MQTSSNTHKRLSTLDIISSKIDGDTLSGIAETGDLLLWANDKPQTKHWRFQLVRAFGGNASVERRCPILHSAVVVKNPPNDILESYGLSKDETGDLYVFDATSEHKHGARLLPIKKWLEFELEMFPGCRVMHRKLEQTNNTPYTPPPEFWQWIHHARTVPYVITPVDIFNLATVNGTYTALTDALTLSSMDMLDSTLGQDRPLTRIASGCLGLMVAALTTLVLCCNFVLVFLLCWLPTFILCNGCASDCTFLGARFPMVGKPTETDKAITGMFCSSCTALTLQRAGILSASYQASWLLPKDFLPAGIGSQGNKLDARLNDGFLYANNFQDVMSSKQEFQIQREQFIFSRPAFNRNNDLKKRHSIACVSNGSYQYQSDLASEEATCSHFTIRQG